MKRSSTAAPGLLLLLGSLCGNASCEALFGGLATGNPESCVATPALCKTPDEVCNTETRVCEPALRIDSVTPAAAPFGQSVPVTLSGKNFVANMTLSFAGKPATMLNLDSESQLLAMAPAGSGSKATVMLDLLSPSSQRLTVSGLFHYFPWPSFDTVVQTNLPISFKIIRSGDFNQDGRPDLAISGDNAVPVSLYYGQAGGTLLAGPSVAFSSRPYGLALGDVNGDGLVDMVVSETGPKPFMEIALGKADGTFMPIGTIQTVSTVGAITILDATADRKADIVIGDGPNVVVYPSLGNGTFAAPINTRHTFQSMDAGTSVAVGDFNGDGLIDLVLCTAKDSRFPVFQNNGNGTFTQTKSYAYSKNPTQPMVGDFNQDGRLDLAMAVKGAGEILLYIGDGSGGFTQGATLSTFSNSDTMGIADMNGDGTADIVTLDTNALAENFDIQAGFGNGQFQRSAPTFLGNMALAGALYVGDLTADGKPDVVIAQRPGTLNLYKNVTP